MKLEEAKHMLKSYSGMTHKISDNGGRPKLDQAIETVLQELEKLENEIEGKECVIETQIHNEEVYEKLLKNSISKNKIKKKIEELREIHKDRDFTQREGFYLDCYEELLEDKIV